jgi:DNA ligase (NAD+)
MSTILELLHEKEAVVEAALRQFNVAFRGGFPLISDLDYDGLKRRSAERFPNNPAFAEQDIESDIGAVEGKMVKLPARMLSTDKAYSHTEIEKWANDVVAVGKSLGMVEQEIFFRVTPKLDGFGTSDDGNILYTRGDGRYGTDITRAIDRGLSVFGGERGKGAGEIVVTKAYFEEVLSDKYENSRNIIGSAIKAGELEPEIAEAIAAGAIVFHPFSALAGWTRNKTTLMCDLEDIWETVVQTCIFDTDGLVIEAMDENIKKHMGHTNHHHKWQIAYKKNTEFYNIKVLGRSWQTAKTGRITPVVELTPTRISGVLVSRATGHHAGNVITQGIDTDAVVRVCRSGLVIPYIESVISPAPSENYVPHECPSCGAPTEMDGDNLMCTNIVNCPAQIEGLIEFFFATLGNIDGFGPKVIEQLNASGYSSVYSIYTMDVNDFDKAGFGGKTSDNLFNELTNSTKRPIEDWRFLAAFSIPNVGKGGCEKLLKHYFLEDVFSLTVKQIIAIDGFAEKTATTLVDALINIKPEFDALMGLGFNLIRTPLASEESASSPIAGKTVVFTGSMQRGGRSDMEKQAKSLGAKVGSSVSSKTDYLVIGTNVGANKTSAAEKHGVAVLTEDEYLKLIN